MKRVALLIPLLSILACGQQQAQPQPTVTVQAIQSSSSGSGRVACSQAPSCSTRCASLRSKLAGQGIDPNSGSALDAYTGCMNTMVDAGNSSTWPGPY